jgi:hypothetical protein
VHALRRHFARILGVLQAEFERVHADRLGHHVHVLLDGEGGLQVAVAAEGAGVGVVGVHRLVVW